MSTITNKAASSKSGGLESMNYYVFDGEDNDEWNEYSIKTLAFAETKVWVEGLTDSTAAEDKKKNAKIYRTLSLTGKTFKYLNRSNNQKEIWEALEVKYVPTEEDDRYELEGYMMENA